jgi:hypothetical protein
VSHFFVDLVPHGDQGLAANLSFRERRNFLFKVIALDLLILSGVVTYIITTKDTTNSWSMALAMFAAMMPDGLHGVAELTRWKVIAWFVPFQEWFHIHTHERMRDWTVPFPVGMVIQITFTLGALWFMK